MEVTSDNFKEMMPLVEETIQKADFIAMDTEFSGYAACLEDHQNEYDSLEEKY